jgi:hypothetical protein
MNNLIRRKKKLQQREKTGLVQSELHRYMKRFLTVSLLQMLSEDQWCINRPSNAPPERRDSVTIYQIMWVGFNTDAAFSPLVLFRILHVSQAVVITTMVSSSSAFALIL